MQVNQKWMFDEVESGRYQGINDSGIEIFNDSVIKSLTREIIQNSLDAKDPESELPVKVVFKRKKIKVSDIPDSLGLLESLKLCVDEAILRQDNKAMTIFQNMVSVIVSREIDVLVVSDYETLGLSKIAEKNGSFDSLVKAEGYSQKGDLTSGGSFGIGKNAAFSASKVRTVFYNTLNKEQERGFQGVTILTSHKNKETKKMRLAKGFYPVDPVLGAHNFFSELINREQVGTDLIICGFESENFDQLCANAVVNDFFMALQKNQLVVEIEDMVIDNSNFAKIIHTNYVNIDLEQKKTSRVEKADIKKTFQFYLALTTSVHLKQIQIGDVLETIEIYVNPSTHEDLCREVVGIRKTGMCIQSFKRFTSRLKFAAIIYMDTPVLNENLKLMENPTHDRWEAARHPQGKKFGAKLLSDIRKVINEVLALYLVDMEQDEIALKGLSDVFNHKANRKILVKDQIKVRDYALVSKKMRASYDSSLSHAGEFIDPNDTKLMYEVLEELYGTLTPSEKNSIKARDNFSIIKASDCTSRFNFLEAGKSEFTFKTKSAEKLYIDFELKAGMISKPFKINLALSDQDLIIVIFNHGSGLIIENIVPGKEYRINLDVEIQHKCVVGVKIREPKK